MVSGFTRSTTSSTSLKQLIFTPADVDSLFATRGIDPPNNTTFDITVQSKSGSQVLIGRLLPSDGAIIFSYRVQSFSAS